MLGIRSERDTTPNNTIIVGKTGYPTIAAALAAATPGTDIVEVQPGSYSESLTIAADQDITGEFAVVTGAHTVGADAHVRFGESIVATGTIGYTMTAAGQVDVKSFPLAT